MSVWNCELKTMKLPGQLVRVIDYRKANASDPFVPTPPILSSSGWEALHLELHHQPKFDIAEHSHTMHIIACGMPNRPNPDDRELATGERWLDGKKEQERRKVGDIAIIPAGISHRCNWNAPVQFGILAIEPGLLQQIGQDWVNPDRIELMPRFMMASDGFIQSIWAALSHELETCKFGGHLLVDSLKTALAIHLLRHYCTTVPKLSSYGNSLSPDKLTRVLDYIHANLDRNLKLSEIAAIAQIGQYHFLNLFKQSKGVTPHQYILRCRIEKAKSLLRHSELNIADIAVRVGFCDQSHLTRYFKRLTGLTPKQYLQS